VSQASTSCPASSRPTGLTVILTPTPAHPIWLPLPPPLHVPAGALLALIVHRVKASVVERQGWWVASLAVLIPLVLTIVPGVLGDYGVAGAW
jgi:hypothetical protein